MNTNLPPTLTAPKEPTFMQKVQSLRITWAVYKTFDEGESHYSHVENFETRHYETYRDFQDTLIEATQLQFRNDEVKKIVVYVDRNLELAKIPYNLPLYFDTLTFLREDWGIDVYSLRVDSDEPIKSFPKLLF